MFNLKGTKTTTKGYGWLARDEDGALYEFKSKPGKRMFTWGGNPHCHVNEHDSKLDFIKWEDREPMTLEMVQIILENSKVAKVTKEGKIVVPKWFDEWYKNLERTSENHRKKLAVYLLARVGFGHSLTKSWGYVDGQEGDLNSKQKRYAAKNKLKLIDAVLNGYVVEEPLYLVRFPDGSYLVSEQERNHTHGNTFIMHRDDSGFLNHVYQFTEKEIKDLDERYWSFAVEEHY